MTLDEILDMWSKDSVINSKALDEESLKISIYQAKYFKIFAKERLILKKLLEDRKALDKLLSEYYSSDMTTEECKTKLDRLPAQKLYKTDSLIQRMVQSDSLMIAKNMEISLQEEKTNLLHEIIKSLNGRGFNQIKNSIDFLRWKNDTGN